MILIQSAESNVSWETTVRLELTRYNCKKQVSLFFKDLPPLLYVNNMSCVLGGNISEICGMRKAVISVTISVTVSTERVASGHAVCAGMLTNLHVLKTCFLGLYQQLVWFLSK